MLFNALYFPLLARPVVKYSLETIKDPFRRRTFYTGRITELMQFDASFITVYKAMCRAYAGLEDLLSYKFKTYDLGRIFEFLW